MTDDIDNLRRRGDRGRPYGLAATAHLGRDTRWAYEKRNTGELAERVEVPVPRWWVAAGVDELGRVER